MHYIEMHTTRGGETERERKRRRSLNSMMRKFTRLASDGLPKSDGLSLVNKEGVTLIVFNDFFNARKLHYSHCV